MGEIIVAFTMKMGLDKKSFFRSHASTVNDYNGGGKIDIFFIGVFMKRVDRKKVISSEKSSLLLAVVPIMTFVCLIMVYPLNIDKRIFSSVCIIAITLNVVTFSINEFMLAKNRRIRILEDENYKTVLN